MAKSRKINNALTRTLDQSSSIVYLVSDELTLSYANEACARWTGIELDSLIGTNLIYTTESLDDPVEEAAKGLAIVPNLISASASSDSSTIKIFSSAGDQILTRSATATAIYDHRNVLSGYLVVGSADDEARPEVDVRSALDTPAALHNALLLVRRMHQNRFATSRLVGTSAEAERIRRQMKSACESASDVLIVGPQGSGREHLARTIFYSQFESASRSGPSREMDPLQKDEQLVPLHCSITDPVQIQATMKELLATVSSTHASTSEKDRATLLLIEVDQLDSASQQELLGYLQLPGISTRMIATSSTDLLKSKAGFDQTLASRLSTLEIRIPPLAQRREDLPLLAQAILESRNDRQAKQFSGFSRQAIEKICEYDWPGNLGQLTATIESAAANATGSIIQVSDLADTFHHSIQAQRYNTNEDSGILLEQYLLDIEQQLIDRAIFQADGNKTKAAQQLGISRAKLLRRLKHFQASEDVVEFEVIDESEFSEETDA